MNGCLIFLTENFFLTRYGRKEWDKIFKEKNRDETYPDETYGIISSASQSLNIAKDEVNIYYGRSIVADFLIKLFELYGEYFIQHISEAGYSVLLKSLGNTLQDWISRVNFLHQHLEYCLPKIISPHIW